MTVSAEGKKGIVGLGKDKECYQTYAFVTRENPCLEYVRYRTKKVIYCDVCWHVHALSLRR